MAVTWAASAAKHGVAREDALHAIANAVYFEEEFDDPRPPSNVAPDLYIGPQRPRHLRRLQETDDGD